MTNTRVPEILARNEEELLTEWVRRQRATLGSRQERISEAQMRSQARNFLRGLANALAEGAGMDVAGPHWVEMRELLTQLSRERVIQGFSPAEVATFVFSFKRPLLDRIGTDFAGSKQELQEEIGLTTDTLDELGLYTFEAYSKSREEVIARQQQEMLELSTPVVELWMGVVALPLIGTLDSERTQIVMQNLLETIVQKGADLAIIDITGVPTVDTLVAQHLLKTVAAARLMGADCIISGIRPQIAQTIIHLGVDLSGVMTKATLADAFKLALQKKNLTIRSASGAASFERS